MPVRKRFPLFGYARHPIRPAEKPNRRLQEVRRTQLDKLLASRDAHRARRLIAFLNTMTLEDGKALLVLIEADNWRDADLEAREIVLSLINNQVVRLRESANFPAIDDPLPGDGRPANVSMRVREILGVR
jgi:hypothetical protein